MRLRNLFFVCADLARSEEFYLSLGLPLLRRGSRSLIFDLGACELHLHQPLTAREEERYGMGPTGPAEGVVLCLETTALDGHAARLEVSVQAAPWGKRMTLVKDPDGRLLELSE